jgi:hypothetical protein
VTATSRWRTPTGCGPSWWRLREGDILSDTGQPLVQNRPALTISADRQVLLSNEGEPLNEEAELAIGRLAELLRIDDDEVLERLTSQRYSPFRPVPIAFDVARSWCSRCRSIRSCSPV